VADARRARGQREGTCYRFFLLAAFDACFPSARRVFFGRRAIVRFRRAAFAALRMLFRLDAMANLLA
jgi:hypothetical protein